MTTMDQTIQSLFDRLAQRKATVNGLKEQIAKSWVTNGTFRLLGATSTTNIQTANEDTVFEIATNLCMLEAAQDAAAKTLALPARKTVQGYTTAQWFSDLNKRLAVINVRQEEAQLTQLEVRLNQVLSPEERRRIEIELLAKEIG